ncbi:tRNA (adenosine(37)-N6)-threonylcarbamoyltransferase complex dimerization subunit type 1 TsaB [Desulfococcaceae bacterium HSG8]|nr:tRNA (adenosine(37)-N6)-threonylcarbamoyltransferase complex dimerization subunit type 1 TsaB [Desulfococcaceae bacterium HSG8]
MKILAIDTATNSCSVGIAASGPEFPKTAPEILAESTIVTRQTHSRHLMGMVRAVLEMSGLTISELDGFAVTRGPGSFTGLRIGISTVKGFAAASGKPLAGVSSLDALAFQLSFSPGLICCLMDARKKEVYCSSYRFEYGFLKKKTEEQVLSPGRAIAGIREPCLFVGNGAFLYQQMITEQLGESASFAQPCHNTIRASAVASLGMERFQNNDTDDVTMFVPRYIRKSEAELSLGV